MNEKSPRVYIGTSGLVLPVNKKDFPPPYASGSRLGYYSSIFNSLELNSSFYKTPQAKTFSKWKNDVANNFKFTVKLSRDITHAKNLDFNAELLKAFMDEINHLDGQKGALLIQFPASITSNYFDHVRKILEQIESLQNDHKWDLAVEVRHNSWYNSDTYRMLAEHRASLVAHDMPGSQTPADHTAKDFIYLRFHGPTGKYNGSYDEDTIRRCSHQIFNACMQGKLVYVYFNNTMGSAYENALSLMASIERLKKSTDWNF